MIFLQTKDLTRAAAAAALYVVLTWAVPAFSYGPVQFRISELLTLLCYLNPIYIAGVTLGTVIANLTSPLGVIDIVFGAGSSFLAFLLMQKMPNIWTASLMPVLCSIFIGVELYIIAQEPMSFWLVSGQIMLSQLIICTIIGVPLIKSLLKNESFVKWVRPMRLK